MRAAKRTALKVAKWALVIAAGVSFTNFASPSRALGHHGHFGNFGHVGHFGHYGGSFGHYGLGGFYGYSGFGYSPFYFNSYRTSYFGYSSPYYYSFAPVYYRPRFYCAPYVVVPTTTYYYSSYPTFWSGVSVNGIPLASQTQPSDLQPQSNAFRTSYIASAPASTSRSNFSIKPPLSTIAVAPPRAANAPLMMMRDDRDAVALASDIQIGDSPIEMGTKYVSSKPALLQPYSPIWTKAASGLVDEMVAGGHLEEAYNSCKGMEKIAQPKGAGVYLRTALLSYFANRSDSNAPSTDEILDLLDLACSAGSQLEPSELAQTSLSNYLQECSVDVKGSMEQLSRWILDNPTQSGRELLLLTALLKLDGQSERAKIFANEAELLASKSNSFHWDQLLAVCRE